MEIITSPRIGIVVLNYKNFSDTIECVDSLLDQDYPNFRIVIVENGSNDDSYKLIRDRFRGENSVSVLANEKNLGFASGNNVGIQYLREKHLCDYVFVLNDDTIVPNDLFKKIVSIELDGKIATISPSVFGTDGNFQPPQINVDNLTRHTLFGGFMTVMYTLLFNLRRFKLFKRLGAPKSQVKTFHHIPDEIRFVPRKYVLQGAAFFLTPVFFRHYNKLYPKTFLYWEEINLMWYLKKRKLQSASIRTSKIIHKKGQSTKILIGDDTNYRYKKYVLSLRSFISSIPLFFSSYSQIKKF